MSFASSPLVWFLLLDSSTGQSYKGTTADAVSLTPGSVVVQFRGAVQAKYDKPTYLKDIPSDALLVYKNKAAFDKRNAAVDDGKENPLDPTEYLDLLGSKEDMLVVVAPPSPPCPVPFYNNMHNATERDGCISFGQNIPSTTLKNLYIRESYTTIASSINPGINKVIITGTPGIGKSLFLIYLLWRLVKEGQRVLFIYHPFKVYYDGQGGVFGLNTIPSPFDSSFWNDTLWCLVDAKYKIDANLGDFPIGLCTFILSTSPQRGALNDFRKPPCPQEFFMPMWSKAELEAIAPFFPNATEWRDRFEQLGGIPRYVLEVTRQCPTEMLEQACMDCSLDECIENIDMNSTFRGKSKLVHLLVHVTSTTPYTDPSMCYASQTALNIIVRQKGDEAKCRMRELLRSFPGNPLVAALCGYISESNVIRFLEKGDTFECRELVDADKRIKSDESSLMQNKGDDAE